jgi:hypothetical protein
MSPFGIVQDKNLPNKRLKIGFRLKRYATEVIAINPKLLRIIYIPLVKSFNCPEKAKASRLKIEACVVSINNQK